MTTATPEPKFDVNPEAMRRDVVALQGVSQDATVGPASRERTNMLLWDKVKTTNTQYTKATGFGAFKFTAVDPQYQLQEATKLWGPYGREWGLKDFRFSTFESMESGKDGVVTVTTMMLEANFMYPGGEFPIAVDMKFKCGQDCCKKLITSARSKSLSYLGFSADVFMGKFDDTAYVNDLKVREGEFNAFEQKALSSIRTAKTDDGLNKAEARIRQMVAIETITGDQGANLLDEISLRRRELAEKEFGGD
jgi:hypothetical protein